MEFKINGVAGASIVYEFKVDTRSNSSLDIDFRISGPHGRSISKRKTEYRMAMEV